MKHRNEIDGLRALAVLPVILFHAGFQTFSGGFVGVDVFFVISGYLITTIIVTEKTNATFTLTAFYERRARRILPALFVVMLACLPFAWLWLLPEGLKQFSQSLAAVPAFASNLLFYAKTGYFDTGAEGKPLLHTWSLAVEEQYYLLFPLLLQIGWSWGRRKLAIVISVLGVSSLALAQFTAIRYPAFAFFLLPARLWELLIGAGAASVLLTRATRIGSASGLDNAAGADRATTAKLAAIELAAAMGLGLIVYAIFAFDRSTPYPSLYTLAPTLGTVCIILFANQSTIVGKLLGNKVLVGVGLVSYSAYLWHQPLFAFARHRSINEPGHALLAALCALTLALAYVSWRFVETPFRRRGQVTRRQVVTLGVTGAALFVVVGAIGHVTGGVPSRFNSHTIAMLKLENEKRQRPAFCDLGVGKSFDLHKACALGTDKKLIGTLLGDSHADAIAFALSERLGERGVGLKDATYLGCPPIVSGFAMQGDDRKCFDYNNAVAAAVTNADALTYVVIVSRWTMWLDGNGENLDNSRRNGNGFDNEEGGVEVLWRPKQAVPDALEQAKKRQFVRRRHTETILNFLKANKRVILVYPIPEMGWNVPTYLAKRAIFDNKPLGPADGSISYDLYKRRNTEAIAILDSIGEHRNLVRIKPAALFCNTYVVNRCVAQIDGKPLYFDDDHLSHEGAARIVSAIVGHMAH